MKRCHSWHPLCESTGVLPAGNTVALAEQAAASIASRLGISVAYIQVTATCSSSATTARKLLTTVSGTGARLVGLTKILNPVPPALCSPTWSTASASPASP